MVQNVIAFVSAAIVMAAVDLVWLAVVAKKFYNSQIGSLLLQKPHLPSAAAFYIIYVIGIVYFAVRPSLHSGTAVDALVKGAAFGFFAYATYDLTNRATLKGFTTKLALVDMAWGTVLTAVVALCAYLITKNLTR